MHWSRQPTQASHWSHCSAGLEHKLTSGDADRAHLVNAPIHDAPTHSTMSKCHCLTRHRTSAQGLTHCMLTEKNPQGSTRTSPT